MTGIKPHSCQRHLEGPNKPCAHQDPDTPQRLSQNCVRVSPEETRVSSGLRQGQGLWVQQTWVKHKPSWRRSPLTHHRAARTYRGLGNRLLEGTNRTLCTRTQEKGAGTPQEIDPDLPGSVQESQAEARASSGLLQGWGH